MRERRGFALMAALWLVVLVGVTGYELSMRSRTQRLAVANALETSQASAAADAALETTRGVLETRIRAFADATADPWQDLASIRADTIQLGDERAVAHVYDAGARLQINRADEDDLRRLFVALRIDAGEADRLAQRIADWRDRDTFRRSRGAEREDYLSRGARVLPADADFAHVEDIREIEGMTPESYARIAPHLTVLGNGQVNVNTAPAPVLASLPGFGNEVIGVVLRAQASGRAIQSFDELTQRLSPSAHEALTEAGAALMQRLSFETREVVVDAKGWVDGSPVRVGIEALYVRNGDALFVASRRATR